MIELGVYAFVLFVMLAPIAIVVLCVRADDVDEG